MNKTYMLSKDKEKEKTKPSGGVGEHRLTRSKRTSKKEDRGGGEKKKKKKGKETLLESIPYKKKTCNTFCAAVAQKYSKPWTLALSGSANKKKTLKKTQTPWKTHRTFGDVQQLSALNPCHSKTTKKKSNPIFFFFFPFCSCLCFGCCFLLNLRAIP
eukprot:TRINITY_DN7363_c0_g1_i1.p1 TRINITY_DN7363_c0_g1~~TRINITY_DN7363_c0_g1_i1.p1  ORF type:complete len:157 (-),score=12.47 TRINITY_DN7363_c0_g1_i1:10-480(-)